jgi:Tol biopolymer transport system component
MLTYVVATKASGEAEVSPLESDVYIINKDGSGKNQITHTLQPEVLVKWMSDGKSIVVDRYKEKPDSNMGGGEKEIVLLHLSK